MTRDAVHRMTINAKSFIKVVSSIHVINKQTHYTQALIKTMNLLITCPKLAGWVAYFLEEVLTQDQWVLQIMAGYWLELTEVPIQAEHLMR